MINEDNNWLLIILIKTSYYDVFDLISMIILIIKQMFLKILIFDKKAFIKYFGYFG